MPGTFFVLIFLPGLVIIYLPPQSIGGGREPGLKFFWLFKIFGNIISCRRFYEYNAKWSEILITIHYKVEQEENFPWTNGYKKC